MTQVSPVDRFVIASRNQLFGLSFACVCARAAAGSIIVAANIRVASLKVIESLGRGPIDAAVGVLTSRATSIDWRSASMVITRNEHGYPAPQALTARFEHGFAS